NGGSVTGAAFVGWDSTYSFNADGRRIPVERISALSVAQTPLTSLSGLGEFTAGGSGTFDVPRYDVRFRASGVSIGEEGIGQLTDLNHLLVDGSIDTLEMSLFDYALRNKETLHLALNQQEVRLGDGNGPLEIVGEGTALRLAGTVGLRQGRIALKASGEANLGILQGFFKDVRSSGRADLTAAVDGPLNDPVFSGRAMIADGRIRHFSMPNSLDAINGA